MPVTTSLRRVSSSFATETGHKSSSGRRRSIFGASEIDGFKILEARIGVQEGEDPGKEIPTQHITMPLGSRAEYGDARYAGAEIDFACDIADVLKQTLQSGFDFLAAPLVNPKLRRSPPKVTPTGSNGSPFLCSDLLLTSSQWASQIVGRTSPWIQPDASDPLLKRDSEAALRQELEWAAHLSLQACIIPVPMEHTIANFARVVLQVLHGLSSMSLWIRIPLGFDFAQNAISENNQSRVDSWEKWNQMRELCGHHAKLGVMLIVPENLPEQAEVKRWLGEPVRALGLDTSIFQTNKRGYPTLSKAHQELVLLFFCHNVQVVLSGQALHAVPPGSQGGGFTRISREGVVLSDPGQPLQVYHEYLSYIFRKPELLTPQQQLEVGYRDYLQAPLQPLQDNLESQTYETFERDVNKYLAYEEAIYAALLERVPESAVSSTVSVLMVVGAGRGPLVRSSRKASQRSGRKLKIFAVEKNPNAVTIVAADMRRWKTTEKADILVSELLGSFGDNELSPECLDGAQRLLKEDGISIPAAYTSYIQPVTCSKLWNDVRAYDDLKHFETPYVVKLHRATELAATQEVFKFSHPNPSLPSDNSRSCNLVFERSGQPAALCHGFAGYFDAHLYGKVHLSTHPPSHTPEMFSWFPIFFPLKEPIYCAQGETITISMWRCTSYHKVWYEWAVTQPAVSHIHNPTGRSYYVGL